MALLFCGEARVHSGPHIPGRVQICGSFSVYVGVKSKMWWGMCFMPFFSFLFFELLQFLALLRVIFSSLFSGTG